MPILGSDSIMAGEMAAIGSFRYCRRSSSATGSAVKYENLPVSGIISLDMRAASCSTVDFAGMGSLGIGRFDSSSIAAPIVTGVSKLNLKGHAQNPRFGG